MNNESFQERNDQERRRKELPYKLGGVGLILYAWLKTNPSTPPHPEGPFELVSADNESIVLKQEDKNYIVLIKDLSDGQKATLVRENPHLKSFLTNGPIHIVE